VPPPITGTPVARVVRSAALVIREMPYVDAAWPGGYSHARIIFRHMAQHRGPLPHHADGLHRPGHPSGSVAFVPWPRVVGPVPAWSAMLAGNASDSYREAPWMIAFPGLAISLAVFAFNLFGDSSRDWLDAKFRT
jgi:peptide/nickel transport system permease protein